MATRLERAILTRAIIKKRLIRGKNVLDDWIEFDRANARIRHIEDEIKQGL